MKFSLLILALQKLVECESASVNEIPEKFMKFAVIMEYAEIFRLIQKRPLQSLLYYYSFRNDIKNFYDLQFRELQCDINDICTLCKNEAEKKFKYQWFYYQFCKHFSKFENKKKFVFFIQNFNFWFLSDQNYTMYTD